DCLADDPVRYELLSFNLVILMRFCAKLVDAMGRLKRAVFSDRPAPSMSKRLLGYLMMRHGFSSDLALLNLAIAALLYCRRLISRVFSGCALRHFRVRIAWEQRKEQYR